jgi:Lar family restriction alleviation protein
MMIKLKNCPFCGSNNLHLTHNGMQNWVIGCGVCQVEMENFVDREQAIKAWNTRTTGGGMTKLSTNDPLYLSFTSATP